MSDFGKFDLDEHAAFWARDDACTGVADRGFNFSLDEQNFAARYRQVVFARRCDAGSHATHSVYVLDGDAKGVTLVSSQHATSESEIARIFAYGGVFRPFCPPEIGAHYGAAFNPNGIGKWFYRTRDKSGNLAFLSQSSFRYSDGDWDRADFLNWSQGDFLSDCQDFWQNPDSEMRRAFEFDKLPIAQRDAQALSCHNATPDELRALMRCVGQLLWADNDYGWTGIEFGQWPYEVQFQSPLSESEAREQKRELRIRAILRAIEPRYLGRGDAPVFVEDWIKSRNLGFLQVFAPTAHEQLEAQLQLRDWARQHLSQVEQSALFALSN